MSLRQYKRALSKNNNMYHPGYANGGLNAACGGNGAISFLDFLEYNNIIRSTLNSVAEK
jgi:hypothetical protein